MPPKSKKLSDKDALWQIVVEACTTEKDINPSHAEYLYKLTTVAPHSLQNGSTCESAKTNLEPRVLLQSLDSSLVSDNGSMMIEDSPKTKTHSPFHSPGSMSMRSSAGTANGDVETYVNEGSCRNAASTTRSLDNLTTNHDVKGLTDNPHQRCRYVTSGI